MNLNEKTWTLFKMISQWSLTAYILQGGLRLHEPDLLGCEKDCV